MVFVFVVLSGEGRGRVRMVVAYAWMEVLLAGLAQQVDVAAHVPTDGFTPSAHAIRRERFDPVNSQAQLGTAVSTERPRVGA